METKEAFIPTPPEGLTHREAADRMARGLDNRPVKDPGKSVGRILADNLFTLFNLLNLVLAVSLALVGSWRNMLFMGVVLSNLFIGTFQELRAKGTIDKLTLLSQAKVRTIREGEELLLSPDQLVQGDLAVFHAGDQICADGVMRFGQGAANEALLTGESDPVPKQPGDTLLSGSFVTEGIITVQLTRVGEHSYASQLIKSAKTIRKPHSELMTSLAKIIRLVSILLVPLGLILFAKQYFFLNHSLNEAVPSTVAAVLGMIPEGLMLLTSMALAVGVVKLGMKNTLVQELYGIESLARVDTLCLDKTGTLTQGAMAVAQKDEGLEEAVSFFLSAFAKEESPTLQALRGAYAVGAADAETVTVPFSSARKWSGAYSPSHGLAAVGAPEFILDERFPQLLSRAAALANEGLRVLAVVVSDQPFGDDQTLPQAMRPLGLICLSDAIRPEAPETLRFFRQQGVEVKVISGDNPLTVSQVARRAGLENWDQAVDAATLNTPEKLYEAAGRYTVFGRVTPQQKQHLVEAMKAQGRTVAMTGDGVNDIPALKAADCSIALAGGSDAA
ncbi:MAG: HAD-IC family P-type ATPase, partial [Clostridia bacterium]|nr:HAD-IC family P-type ATPase [Clostridia bacterium]